MGLYAVSVPEAHPEALWCRLERVNDVPVDQVLERLGAYPTLEDYRQGIDTIYEAIADG